MKKLMMLAMITSLLTASQSSCAQGDKSKRASPLATASARLTNDATVTINYGQPSIKGRTIGKDIAPFGKVWRTGANEATTFETTKDVTINGNKLPAGKYSLYTIPGEDEWTVIFNKNADQWGTRYDEQADLFRFAVKPKKGEFMEQMNFYVEENGVVRLMWGTTIVDFKVE